jgi:hypothetical protein
MPVALCAADYIAGALQREIFQTMRIPNWRQDMKSYEYFSSTVLRVWTIPMMSASSILSPPLWFPTTKPTSLTLNKVIYGYSSASEMRGSHYLQVPSHYTYIQTPPASLSSHLLLPDCHIPQAIITPITFHLDFNGK